MELGLTFYRGAVIVTAPEETLPESVKIDGDILSLARAFGLHYRGLLHPVTVKKPRGVKKGFSFHWSNAQAAWDVIAVSDPSWSLDGAEFMVYFRPGTLSPVGRPWSLKEMQYVASKLKPHPGYASSPEAGYRAARLSSLYFGGLD